MLEDLARLRSGVRRMRASSYDVTGGNADAWKIAAGETRGLFASDQSGCVKHLWVTMAVEEKHYPRKILLRAYWDGEPEPSIDVPIGDFFGVGHGRVVEFWSLPLQMSPRSGRGWNCWFPMPFEKARIEVVNECERTVELWFYVDYELRPIEPDLGRFHAQWRRENPTEGWGEGKDLIGEIWKTPNRDGKGNYVILEARGRGHYVGLNLNIHQFERQKNPWYGEGDDMIFIDGDEKPTLHGTGTEDYFNTAFGPTRVFSSPYHGITLCSGEEWLGFNSLYRFHIEDPVYFERSIRVTIEHGHANCLSNDYSSTAYWYQAEPHAPFPPMPGVTGRLPRE